MNEKKIEKINLDNETNLGKKVKPSNNPLSKKKNESDEIKKINGILNSMPTITQGAIRKTTSFQEDNEIYAANVVSKKEKNMDDFFGILNNNTSKEVYTKPVVKKKLAPELNRENKENINNNSHLHLNENIQDKKKVNNTNSTVHGNSVVNKKQVSSQNTNNQIKPIKIDIIQNKDNIDCNIPNISKSQIDVRFFINLAI